MNILVDGQTLETEEINRGIGVYLKNVLYNMIENTVGNVWYITISHMESMSRLDSRIVARLIPVVDEYFAPSFDYDREDIYTERLNDVIEKYDIEAFWTPNPLMVNVIFPNNNINCSFFATIHDLIPYVMPIKEWSDVVTGEYHRRLDYLKKVNMICVSEATKRDVQKKMGNNISTFVTLEAANNKLFYCKRTKLNNTNEINIVFTGGFDYRKNIYGAVEAFAGAKKKLPQYKLRFYIVCKYAKEEKEKFDKRLIELGISDEVELTGFIKDCDLVSLYNRADVFFFPSLYEGFGLPILEAMLGGAYILSADNSSLPEVCGEDAIFCDAENISDMTDKLVEAINNSKAEDLADKQKRQEYALGFTWKKTALKTFDAMSQTVYKNSEIVRKKIAIVTPWPGQQTGIATYVYKLMPYLNKYFDADIFVDNTLDSDTELIPYNYGKMYMINELDNLHNDYEEIIYHLGNNTKHHTGIYTYLRKYPGIAEIHDYVVHAFFYHSFYLREQPEMYRQALSDGYGESGLKHYDDVVANRSYPDEKRFPMCHSISNIAKRTIVHNVWSYMELPGENKKDVIPLACFENKELSVNDMRRAENMISRRIGRNQNEIIIACFGWVNDNKRPDVLVRAVSKLIDMNYRVRLCFFGANNSDNILRVIDEEGLYGKVAITGFISEDEYVAALNMADIVVNLRYPSMGESSATLCEAFKAAKPVIVTAVNQYLEFPDDVCWKLPVGESEVLILTEMIKYLIDNKEDREILGRNAKDYADNVLSGDSIAKMYYRIVGQE